MTEKTYLVPIEYKEVLKKVGIVCFIVAVPLFFVDASAALTLAVMGIECYIQRRLHGKRVEDMALACFVGAIPLFLATLVIGPWNLLGGFVLLILGGFLWSEGF